ncbi:IucA/IucC family siderophore biosynthesis protein [Shewanella sp. KX20019]|uniref:IucA/IucC family protein n=1 Tax=Shewanella sp. KX20019 TaxID=2803864 RepID=UPI001927F936|nr:IucA/IucC family protein [Shewanella sp. KX20019]QQX80254.1 IucA/IucC family siderophore biosynthesis protein [Shewanella sp. KX20019]
MSTAKQYISQRIIDACLRENVCELVTKGEVISSLPQELMRHWRGAIPESWLKVSHLSSQIMYVPIAASHYMQSWRAESDAWISHDVSNKEAILYGQGYKAWLTVLSTKLPPGSKRLFLNYIQEADCATTHHVSCKQVYNAKRSELAAPFGELESWHQSLMFSDQIASYLDHPYYPTARAKVGFDTDALALYAPEFAAKFELNWCAAPANLVTLTSVVPTCWPSMSDVGLEEFLAVTHKLFPVHPLTAKSLECLPEGVVIAPKTALTVQASLSVRTLALADFPSLHIKVPLLMATLGAKNIRSIKPSTLYDGHWFERMLSMLAKRDKVLATRIEHVDEQHGGHLGDSKLFAYIVRGYSANMQCKQLVPVAALASPMPDGRLYLQHLVDQYYQGQWQRWFGEYLDLMLKVHLRLWLKYGVALESNQQNAILAYKDGERLSLVMKDNDSARLLVNRYEASLSAAELAQHRVDKLIDQRIFVADDEALAQMFTTITLQLDIAAIIEAMATNGMAPVPELYYQLRSHLVGELDALQQDGVETDYARHYLLSQPYLPVKYLLSSGSLLSKADSGATDVNKFYGQSAPNFLLAAFCEPATEALLVKEIAVKDMPDKEIADSEVMA